MIKDKSLRAIKKGKSSHKKAEMATLLSTKKYFTLKERDPFVIVQKINYFQVAGNGSKTGY